MAMAIAPQTKMKLDMTKVLKMIAIHDIPEIEAGDVPSIHHMGNKIIATKKRKRRNASSRKYKEDSRQRPNERRN